jgi:DNA-binding transcriptional LysR family regulator
MKKFVLDDALTFLEVVKTGSFAAASKNLGVTASVVSKRIARLEHDLKVQLLQRTTRNLSLTETGEKFSEHCKRIQYEISEATAAALTSHQQLQGILRINVPMGFGQTHLVPAVSDFIKQYSEIEVELVFGSHFANFIDNGLDLAIFIKDLPDTHQLRARKLCHLATGVFVAPEYLKKYGIPKFPSDLEKHNCLIATSEPGHKLGSNYKHEWNFINADKEIKVIVTGNIKANSSQAVISAAIAGSGIVRIPSFMVSEKVNEGKLVGILKKYWLHNVPIYAVYPNQQYLPNKVRVFIDFLVARFSATNYWNC